MTGRTERAEKAERTEYAPRPLLSVLSALSALSALSCARIEPPPGGPPDTKPPTIVSVVPDSMAVVPGFDGDVVFTFNETVSEGSQASEGYGTGDLERLILLSPTEKVPVVQWRRNRITVRPREGWRDSTVYRVELLPGLTDIRSNRSLGGRSVTFSTGGPKPDYTLRGKVYDWNTSQPAKGVLLEAVLEPDSLVYRSATDSSGSFTLGPLPRGTYVVFAVTDQNRDRKRGAREVFDSVRVTDDSGKVPELWMFQHDTTQPRMQPPTVTDSVTLSIPFNQKLDPYQKVDTSMIVVQELPDSSRVAVVSLMFPAAHDSLYRAAPPRPDSAAVKRDTAAVRRDTVAKAPVDSLREFPVGGDPDSLKRAGPRGAPAALSRPPLVERLTARLATPLKPGVSYTVFMRGLRSVSGIAMDSSRAGFKVPERPKLTAADSLRQVFRRMDSARTVKDTTLLDSLRKTLPDSLQQVPLDSLLRAPARPAAPRTPPKK